MFAFLVPPGDKAFTLWLRVFGGDDGNPCMRVYVTGLRFVF